MKSCPKCNAEHSKKGVYCSLFCSNRKEVSRETRGKISASLKLSHPRQLFNLTCVVCQKTFESKKRGTKTCGSLDCIREAKTQQFRATIKINNRCGGYRPNSGRSNSGYYKGIYCGSTYELAFLIWNLDNGINISRCDKIFEYEGGRRYYPDFEIEGKIFEIKGFHTEEVSLKEAAVVNSGAEYEILYKSDLDPMIQYVKVKYGVKNLYDLYDKEVVPRYTYKCETCGAEIKTQIKRNAQYVFCNRKCIRTKKFIKKNLDITP